MCDIRDKIFRIQYDRMKPEHKYLYELICRLTPYKHINHKNSIFYFDGNFLIFEHNVVRNDFWFDVSNIDDILRYNFGGDASDTSNLVKIMVEKFMNIKGINQYGITLTRLFKNDNKLFKKIE